MRAENRGIEYPTCDHGYRTDRSTKDDYPLCPWCRDVAKARRLQEARTTQQADARPSPSAPVVDHAALAAHDLDLLDHLEDT